MTESITKRPAIIGGQDANSSIVYCTGCAGTLVKMHNKTVKYAYNQHYVNDNVKISDKNVIPFECRSCHATLTNS